MKEKFELKNIKGSTDFLPNEQIIRNKIITELRSVFELNGYLPLETPILCYFDLLAYKYAGGSEILKEVYKLKDQGNRKLGLRYDLTVPFSKIIAMNKDILLPFRRYEIGKVFRDGPVKPGRCREFYQCDVDVCGLKGTYIESELLLMAVCGYKRLGIDIDIKWNNRKFLSGIIEDSGIGKELISQTILLVDKMDKITECELKNELLSLGIKEISIVKLFNYFRMSINDLISIFKDTSNILIQEGLKEIDELNNQIKELGIEDNCIFTPFLARGLEIYTGTVWEFFDKKKRITSSIGSGGRYDKIITSFINDGNEYPAVGMSFGLEPIYEICKNDNLFTKDSLYDVYIYSFDKNAYALKIANELRKNNIRVLVEMQDIKLKKALNFANKSNIINVLIIGEDEIKNNTISYKNMQTGIQKSVSVEELKENLSI